MESLYRKLRPRRFADMVGQEHILKVLRQKTIKRDENNLLFVGPPGTGKTTSARIVGAALNCKNSAETGEPCCDCPDCRAIIEGTSPDVFELDAASNNSVEAVRDIIEQANYKSPGKCRVFIIDECHMLSTAASNALLKTLEEPPSGVIFILCTTEEDKVLPAIKSRCQIHRFKNVPADTIAEYLKGVCEDYQHRYEEDALALIALNSDGSMRNSLSLLESVFDLGDVTVEAVAEKIGLAGEDAVFDILTGVNDHDTKKALNALSNALSSGRSVTQLIRQLLRAINDLESAEIGGKAVEDKILNTARYKQRLHKLLMDANIPLLEGFAKSLWDVIRSVDKTLQDIGIELAVRTAISVRSELSGLSQRLSEVEYRLSGIATGKVALSSPVAETPAAVSEQPKETATATPVEEREKAEPEPSEALDEAVEDDGFMPEPSDLDIPFDEEDLSGLSFGGGVSVEEAVATATAEPVAKTSEPSEESNIVAFPSKEESVPDIPDEDDISSLLPEGMLVSETSADDYFAEGEGEKESAEPEQKAEEKPSKFQNAVLFGGDDLADEIWEALSGTPMQDTFGSLAGGE